MTCTQKSSPQDKGEPEQTDILTAYTELEELSKSSTKLNPKENTETASEKPYENDPNWEVLQERKKDTKRAK